jgi:hypothetical protein
LIFMIDFPSPVILRLSFICPPQSCLSQAFSASKHLSIFSPNPLTLELRASFPI